MTQGNYTSAVDFWIAKSTVLPTLASLALDIVSASQAYVERVFSVCGDITSGKRNRLSKNLSNRVFLRMNRK